MSSMDKESLRKLSYSELEKHAKKSGVKVNKTAHKIIANFLEKSCADEDSFISLERSIVNSSKKNKEALFNRDSKRMSKTPRRDTYNVDTPSRNSKASKAKASLLEKSADEDSFVTLERSILNSCRKNKEALFDRDSKRISATPRRDTFIVDTPSTNSKVINTSTVMASASPELKGSKDESLNVTLSRGSEKKGRKSKRKVSFVTPLRRSTRLSAATPQFNSVKGRPKTPMPSRLSSAKRVSVADKQTDAIEFNLDLSEDLGNKKSSEISTVTPAAQQCGKVTKAATPPAKATKVALTPAAEKVEITPIPSSKKDAASATQKKVEVTPAPSSSKKNASSIIAKMVEVTPVPSSKKSATLASGFKKSVTPFLTSSGKSKSACTTPRNQERTPMPKSSTKARTLTPRNQEKTPMPKSSTKARTHTPGFKKSSTPFSSFKREATPRPKVNTPKLTSSAVKKTPNFNKLHERAFEKMESITDYHLRKLRNSEKKKEEQNKFFGAVKSNASKSKRSSLEKLKKAPKVFGGIPFIPSAATTKPMKINLKSKSENKLAPSDKFKTIERNLAKKATAGKVKAIKSVSRENTPLKQRHKFDLKASLAKKLPYKPHSGPLKPLNAINLNSSALTPLPPTPKVETKNQVVTKARIQSREVLHKVRKNKRFMLQMNNRNLNMSVQ